MTIDHQSFTIQTIHGYMVYYAGELFGVINVNERAKNRDEVGVEGHKEAWQAKIFFTLVELTTQFLMIPIP